MYKKDIVLLYIICIIIYVCYIWCKTRITVYDYILLICIVYLVYNRSYTIDKKKETFIDFNVSNVLSKLSPVKNIDSIKSDNIAYFLDNKNNEIKNKTIHMLPLLHNISKNINGILNDGIFKLVDFNKKIRLIYDILLKTFQLLFKIVHKFKSFDNLKNIIKELLIYIKDELIILDRKYQRIKVDWDTCFASNGVARYIGLNNSCDKAYRNTQKLRIEVRELPEKIIEKYNTLDIKNENDKIIDFAEIKNDIVNNKELFNRYQTDFSFNNIQNIENTSLLKDNRHVQDLNTLKNKLHTVSNI